MHVWRIEMLGGLAARGDGQEIRRFQTSRAASLLAILACDLGREYSRDDLIERLWPDSELEAARRSLSQAVYNIRHQLGTRAVNGDRILVSNQLGLRLEPLVVTTDLEELRDLLRCAERCEEGEELARLADDACALYRGPLAPGCYDDPLPTERELLEKRLLRVLRRASSTLEARGDVERAIDFALRAVRIAPSLEEAHQDVIRLYLGAGLGDNALSQFDHLTRIRRREGAGPPSPETRALVKDLIARRKSGGAARRPGRPPASTTGRANRPLAAATPCPAPDSRRAPRLPALLNRFIGREDEVARLAASLAPAAPEPASVEGPAVRERLLTLVGPGGAGKTRLAIEAGYRLAPAYEGVVCFVPLADVTERAGLEERLRETLELPVSPPAARISAIVKALQAGPSLLILDNFEHLVESCAPLLWELLQRLPRAALLVTSRRATRIPGEHLLHVHPLAVPDRPGSPERLLEFEAVQLFVDRARAVQPAFHIHDRNAEAVALICQQLDGIPLAIELAAARSRSLTPAQMVAQLEDRFGFLVRRDLRMDESRHETLHAAIAWSCELLTDQERRCLEQLSVFRGGWTQSAAAAVWDADDTLGMLETLLDHSLILSEPDGDHMRFRMLESIREFAQASLPEAERRAAADRHAGYFVRLAEQTDSILRGPEMRTALSRLSAEHENLRAALDWTLAEERGLRLATALRRFWTTRGHAEEGIRYLSQFLDEHPAAPADLRLRALVGAGGLAHEVADFASARDYLYAALRLSDEASDARSRAEAFSRLGKVEWATGDSALACELYENSLAIWRELKDRWGIAAELNNVGLAAQEVGDIPRAIACYEESQQIYEALRDWAQVAVTWNNLGAAWFSRGQMSRARAAFGQALDLVREMKNPAAVASITSNIGEIHMLQERYDEAARHLREGLLLRREHGLKTGVLNSIALMGSLARRTGDAARAARLLGFVGRASERSGQRLQAHPLQRFAEDVEALKATLDPEEFEAAWLHGEFLSLERAVTYALEESFLQAGDAPAFMEDLQRP